MSQHQGGLEWQHYLSAALTSLEGRHVATLLAHNDLAQDVSWSSTVPSAWPASCSPPLACTPQLTPESVT
ncbi:hypothetical protein E2C01_060284 [Portunus trituberculatus]|uniref:Uncharacterized protein n=1 Tax=Portunus trituberculatus TaxID=210409 RepID=A0A5B7H8G5_PORTR|nr:hypothetical protein [Portunus trituberculatus]